MKLLWTDVCSLFCFMVLWIVISWKSLFCFSLLLFYFYLFIYFTFRCFFHSFCLLNFLPALIGSIKHIWKTKQTTEKMRKYKQIFLVWVLKDWNVSKMKMKFMFWHLIRPNLRNSLLSLIANKLNYKKLKALKERLQSHFNERALRNCFYFKEC